MRILFAVLAVLCIGSESMAQRPIIIQPQHRRPNESPGCCGPSTLESVARSQGYTQITGYTTRQQARPFTGYYPQVQGCPAARSHPCHSSPSNLVRIAHSYGIPTQSRPVGSYDTTLIQRGMATGRPVIVSVGPVTRCGQGHFHAVVKWGNPVYLYDVNVTERPYVTMRRSTFMRQWSGDSLLLGR